MKINLTKNKLACIKEIYYACGTDPELDLLLLDYYHPHDFFWRTFDYAWLVYLDQPRGKELICFNLTLKDERPNLPKRKFIGQLKKLTDFNMISLAYLCTFYMMSYKKEILSKIFNHYNSKIKILHPFTRYSYGRLVFNHQAAFLYGLLTGEKGNQALKWLGAMMKKNPIAVQKAKGIPVTDNHNLYDIWQEMTINGEVYNANWKGAELLSEFLRGNN